MPGGLAAALPLALGAAISPTVLIANLLVLSSPQKSRIRGAAFAVGGLAVLIVVGVLALTVLHTAAENRGKDAALFAWVDIVFAGLLALVGLRSLPRPPKSRPPKPKPPSERATKLAHAPTYDYLAFGVVMMLTNVTTLMLFIPAMKDVAVADASVSAKAGMATLVVLITSMVVWVPLGLDLAAPHTAGRVLGGLNRYLAEHQRTVGMVVAFGFAVYLAAKGIREL